MKNLTLTAALILLMSSSLFSQALHNPIRLKADNTKEIKSRTLIVELLEIDDDRLATLQKKVDKAKKSEAKSKAENMLNGYKDYVTDYNANIQSAVEKEWTLNESVEFKTTSEIKALNKSKSKKYSVLWYNEQNIEGVRDFKYKIKKGTVPAWNYGFIEGKRTSGQFQFAFPSTAEANVVTEAELGFFIRLITKHFEAFEKEEDKKYFIHKLAEDEADENCNDITDQNLNVPSHLVDEKQGISDLNTAYTKDGEVVEMSQEDYLSALENKEDVLLGISAPYMMTGSVAVPNIAYFTAFINPSTMEFYTAHGTDMGDMTMMTFRKAQFKWHGAKCK